MIVRLKSKKGLSLFTFLFLAGLCNTNHAQVKSYKEGLNNLPPDSRTDNTFSVITSTINILIGVTDGSGDGGFQWWAMAFRLNKAGLFSRKNDVPF